MFHPAYVIKRQQQGKHAEKCLFFYRKKNPFLSLFIREKNSGWSSTRQRSVILNKLQPTTIKCCPTSDELFLFFNAMSILWLVLSKQKKSVTHLAILQFLRWPPCAHPASVLLLTSPCCHWKYPYFSCNPMTVRRRTRQECILSVKSLGRSVAPGPPPPVTPAGICRLCLPRFDWRTGCTVCLPRKQPPPPLTPLPTEVWSTVWSHEQVRAVHVRACALRALL